jgi:hypothetical protein
MSAGRLRFLAWIGAGINPEECFFQSFGHDAAGAQYIPMPINGNQAERASFAVSEEPSHREVVSAGTAGLNTAPVLRFADMQGVCASAVSR